MVEQILINPVWSMRLLGDQVQVGPELDRPNQVMNLMRGLWRRGSEIEMESRVVQL